jgi:phosphoglycolate phosphatase
MNRSDLYPLVIFDWDGTLQDSIGSIVACTQATLAELDQVQPDDEVIRGSIGLGLRDMVGRFAPGHDERLFQDIVRVYRRLWFGEYRLRHQLFPGVRNVLAKLAQRGTLMAVATAKSRRGLDEDLATTDLGPYFAATRTADEARSKPHPQMILDILSKLDIAPEDSLVIGDTSHDLEMAHNAGAAAAAVLTGSHDADELRRADPLVCFEDLRELPAWLDGTAGEEVEP